MGIDSNFLKLLIGGFTMGWGPCLAYSAPLLLPYIGGTKTGWKAGLKIGVMFSLGRLLALAILGGVVTFAFSSINRFFPPHRSGYLYLFVALFMITLGIFIILGKGFGVGVGKIVKKRILDSGAESMLFLGFLIGISPCVPLVAVLTYIACVADNIGLGILYALSFGIGAAVAPIILGALVGILPEKLFKSAKLLKAFQIICGTVLILFGLQLIYYVLNLLS
ncbi:MAG: sulfite exporter TauE/SafE family protein [candidate division Zixibacteria bacterium]|nr:sulfite exporter TauE/SafE family protein [candidate division Zixibacteria bacterium]